MFLISQQFHIFPESEINCYGLSFPESGFGMMPKSPCYSVVLMALNHVQSSDFYDSTTFAEIR